MEIFTLTLKQMLMMFSSISVTVKATSELGAGLVNGKNNLIAPADYTTRAEVAVLIKRILDHIK